MEETAFEFKLFEEYLFHFVLLINHENAISSNHHQAYLQLESDCIFMMKQALDRCPKLTQNEISTHQSRINFVVIFTIESK